jgi:hypothetical protein
MARGGIQPFHHRQDAGCAKSSPFSKPSADSPPPAFRSHGKGPPKNVTCAPAVPSGTDRIRKSGTATCTFFPSTAEPHCTPPALPPWPTCFCQNSSPCLSGLQACPRPAFWPAINVRWPFASSTKIGDEPKSKSGPFASGQLFRCSGAALQSTWNAWPSVRWRDHAGFPVAMSKARNASEVRAGGSEFEELSPCCAAAPPSEAKRSANRLNAKIMEKFLITFYRVGETKIDFGIIIWTPLLPSTSSVMWRSAATLESM